LAPSRAEFLAAHAKSLIAHDFLSDDAVLLCRPGVLHFI
jgi:hypothetical protein